MTEESNAWTVTCKECGRTKLYGVRLVHDHLLNEHRFVIETADKIRD